MAKENWITQKDLKDQLGLNSIAVVNNWILRGLINTKIIYGKTLVDANSIKKKVRGRPKKAVNGS